MKRLLIVAVLSLTAAVAQALTTTNLVLFQDQSGAGYSTNNDPLGWWENWPATGYGPGGGLTMNFDTNVDAGPALYGPGTNGSMHFVMVWNDGAGTTNNNTELQFSFGTGGLITNITYVTNTDNSVTPVSTNIYFGTTVSPLENAGSILGYVTNYQGISFDVMVNPANSTLNQSTNWLDSSIREQPGGGSGSEDWYGFSITNSPYGVWQHVNNIWPPTFDGTYLRWFGIYLADYNFSPGHLIMIPHAQTEFWIDNLQLIARSNTIVRPHIVDLVKAQPGLNLTTASASARENLTTVYNALTANLDFIEFSGSSGVTTIGWAIKSFPNPIKYPGYVFHMWFLPTATAYEGMDWNEANAAELRILGDTNGIYTAQFSYKTNVTFGYGGQFEGTNTLVIATNGTVIGTWTLAIDPSAHSFSLKGPGGLSTNFTMASDAAAYFPAAEYVTIGCAAAVPADVNQTMIVGYIGMTNANWAAANSLPPGSALFYDPFTAETINTNLWTVAADPAGVVLVPADAPYFLDWSVPDISYYPGFSTNLASKPINWMFPPLTKNLCNTNYRALLYTSIVPWQTNKIGFWTMINTNGGY